MKLPEKKIPLKLLYTLVALTAIGSTAAPIIHSAITEPTATPVTEHSSITTPEPVVKPHHPGNKFVALGDSTVALSDGHITDWDLGCRHERGNWTTKIARDVKNIACAGANVQKTIVTLDKSQALGETTDTVFITVGSNSFRESHSRASIQSGLDVLVADIKKKAPQAEIVFVGYLPVPANDCITEADNIIARRLHQLHVEGDEMMREAAEKHGAVFVDNMNLTYNICSPQETFVRVGDTSPGAPWHTTPKGHDAVAANVKKAMGW